MPTAMTSAYDRRYRNARARVLQGAPLCACGRPATTADHQPALAHHDHVGTGRGCCQLVPMCPRCNYRAGGRIGGRRLARKRAARREASRLW